MPSTGATQFVVSGNTANQGGGVYANADVTLSGHTSFTGNTANNAGGAIFATGNVSIVGSAEFSGNTAATEGGVTGSGASASYATNLKGFHMGDGTTLSLDMNVAGNAALPYFTLADGFAATTGTGTTLYGVIGSNLANAAEGQWTYSIFAGSNGAANDFAPAVTAPATHWFRW